MEVSIHKEQPGITAGAGFFPRISRFERIVGLIGVCLIGSAVHSPAAHGFTLRESGGNSAPVQLLPSDIRQAGGNLGAGVEQTFPQGNYQSTLSDFSQPVDIGFSPAVSAALGAAVEQTRAFEIRLTNAERAQCLSEADFDVDLRFIGAGLSATGPGGGMVLLSSGDAQFDRSTGGQCPNRLRYGYALELGLDGAIASGLYVGDLEITATRIGPGGQVETLQLPVAVDMPNLLLLYHASRIDIDLQASAIASAFGAATACGGGFCAALGGRTIPVTLLGVPVNADLTADLPPFTPVQTITLRDAVGARAMGCAADIYDTASYQVVNPTGGILASTGVIAGLQSQPCGMTLRTGDFSIDLDLSQADGTARASAIIQITVTGL